MYGCYRDVMPEFFEAGAKTAVGKVLSSAGRMRAAAGECIAEDFGGKKGNRISGTGKRAFYLLLSLFLLLLPLALNRLTASADQSYVWDFTDGTQGWTASGTVSASSSNGILTLSKSADGSGPVYSPTVSLNTADYRYLIVNIKNAGAGTYIKFYCNIDNAGFSESAKFDFQIAAASDEFVEYCFDLSTLGYWTGTFNRFMLGLTGKGNVHFDSIRFSDTYTPPSGKNYEWNFTDGTQGWTASGTVSASSSNGILTLSKSADGSGPVYSPTVSLNTADYRYLIVNIKNAGAGTYIKFYCNIDNAGFSESAKFDFQIAAASDEFVEYCFDLSTLGYWTGTFNRFMLGLTGKGNVHFDSIRFSDTPPGHTDLDVSVSVIPSSDQITSEGGSVTLSAQVTAAQGGSVPDTSVSWITDTVNAVMTRNPDGSVTLTGKINGSITVTAISNYDPLKKDSVTVTISGQSNKMAVYDTKVIFFGNSITRHEPNADLGWYGDWGMAASSRDKDFIHRLMDYYVFEKYGAFSYSINSVNSFEREVSTDTAKNYSSAVAFFVNKIRDYEADILILQGFGNISANYDGCVNAFTQLIGGVKSALPDLPILLINTGGHDYITQALHTVSQTPAMDFTYINWSAERKMPQYLAPSFTHPGVAAHPGDTGMDNIAQRIWDKLDNIISLNFTAVYEALPAEILVSAPADSIATDAGVLQFAAEVLPAGTGQEVRWSVDNPDFATISDTGLLTAKNNGSVTITATSVYADVSGSKTILISGQSAPFTVTYHAGTTDTVTGLPSPDPYAKGEFIPTGQKPSRAFYKFLGWSPDQDSTPVPSIAITGDTTLYAVWQLASYWEFNENQYAENISVQNGFNVGVSDGRLNANATGTDPVSGNVLRFVSPALSLPARDYNTFVLYMRHSAKNADTKLTLDIQTSDGSSSYSLPVTSADFTRYVFDLSGCTGTITGFTLSPVNLDCTVSVDYIRFSSGNKLIYSAGTSDTVTNLPQPEYAYDGAQTVPLSSVIPKRTNYHFTGWSETPGGSVPVGKEIPFTAGKTIYAIWRYNHAWDFEIDGDAQGWTSANLENLTVSGGILSADAKPKEDGSYDPIIGIIPAPLDTSVYTKVKLRMSYTLPAGVNSTMLQIYFTTLAQSSLSESASQRVYLTGNSSHGFIDVEVDFSDHALWNGSTLTYLRIDPISGSGSFAFDSIALVFPVKASFLPAGGAGSMPDIAADLGDTVILPENAFTRDGYTFAGWSDGLSVYAPGSAYPLTEDTEFTALWERGGFGLLGARLLLGATALSEETDIHLLCGINRLDYSEVGIILSSRADIYMPEQAGFSDYAALFDTNTVYRSIVAANEEFLPGDFEGQYIFAITITGIPNDQFGSVFYVTAYAKGLDGSITYGDRAKPLSIIALIARQED